MNFREIAVVQTTASELMAGRDKVSTDYMISNYKDGFTLKGFDLIHGNDGDYVVCNIEEDDKIFFTGGKVLTEICKAWIEASGGLLCKEVSNQLAEAGGIKMALTWEKAERGNKYVGVTIL